MKKKFRKVCSLPLALLSVAFATGCATTESSTASNSSAEVPVLKGNGNFTFNAKNVGYKSEHGYGFVAIDGNLDSVKCSSGMLSAEETVRFQANVENGNYKVTVITNQTSLISESITDNVPFTLKNEDGVEFTGTRDFSKDYVDAATKLPLIGVPKNINSGESFEVAVCDEILDLTFVYKDTPITVSKISIEPVELKKREMPYLIAMGDSTCALGDQTITPSDVFLSWGAAVTNGDVALPDTLGGFVNCSESGADMVTAYVHGRVEKMLLNVRPGDYVAINMGINNNKAYTIGGVSVAKSGSMNAFVPLLEKYYVEGVKQRGGIPFITTITAQGPGNKDTVENTAVYTKEERAVTQSFGTDIKGYRVFYNLGSGSNYNSGKNYAAGKAYAVGENIPAHKWINSRHGQVYNMLLLYTANALGLQVVDLGVYGENYLNLNMSSESDFATVRDTFYTDKHHYRKAWGIILAQYVLEQVSKMQDGIYAYPYYNYEPVFLCK